MSPLRILVVDDNPLNLKLAARVLESPAWKIIQADGAAQALAWLDRELPDLILMDIGLPGINGLVLTRQIKDKAATRHIKIIALTASAMKGDEQAAMNAGCDGYITKPIDTRKLPTQIEEILARLAQNDKGTA